MPYTNYTANGTTYGNISPAEALQAQTASNAAARAAAEDARSAQMHMLKQSLQGGGGDDFFSPSGPFGIAPKETGAVDLASRNAAVDSRQMDQANRDANMFRNTGLTANAREGIAREHAASESGQLQEADALHPLVMKMFQDALGGGGASAGATPAGMNPNFTSGGINLGAMGGGTAPAAGGAPGKGIDYRLLGAIAALRNHTTMPDYEGQDQERAYTKQRNALDIKQREADLTDQLARRSKTRADELALETDPTAISAKYPEVTAPLAQAAANFVAQDTKTIGWDPTEQDITGLLQERDRAALGLRKRGLDPAQAQAEANRAIVQALGPNRNDLNSGWTKKLLARIGMGGDSAATPGTGPRMPYLPGL